MPTKFSTNNRNFTFKYAAAAALLAFALMLAGCGSTSSTTPPPAAATLVSIAVAPASMSIPVNGTHQFTATGTYSDASTKSLTALVTWSSSAPSIATVDAAGVVTAVASGSANILATLSGVSGSRSLTVTPILSSISVTPASPTSVVNTTTQLTAIGTWSDGSAQDITSQVTWASVDSSIATVDSSGLATALLPGSTGVSATVGAISGSMTLTVDPASLVSIVVSPDQSSVPAGISQPFTATGIFNNGSTQPLVSASWGSSDSTIATIDNAGNATTLIAGTVTITATSGSVTGSTTFTVLPAVLVSISFNPPSPSLALGTSVQFTAIGLFTDGSTQTLSVTWGSSDPSTVSVDTNGFATSQALGSATVTVSSGSITANVSVSVTPAVLASIAVTPLNPSIPAGFVQQFAALGTFTDSTTQDLTNNATWTSSAGNIATISNSGLATAVTAGNATMTASFGSVSAGTTLTVSPALLQSVTISPIDAIMTNGTTFKITATGHYSDSTTQDISPLAAWSSTDSTIASVDSTGLVTGRKPGVVTITAAMGGLNASTTLTVANHTLQGIVVTPVNPTLNAGQTLQFSATGYFADGTTQDLTKSAHWSTSAANLVTINSGQSGGGLSTAKAAGTATITATFSGVSGSTTLTIN